MRGGEGHASKILPRRSTSVFLIQGRHCRMGGGRMGASLTQILSISCIWGKNCKVVCRRALGSRCPLWTLWTLNTALWKWIDTSQKFRVCVCVSGSIDDEFFGGCSENSSDGCSLQSSRGASPKFSPKHRSSSNQRPNHLAPRSSRSSSAPVSPCRTPRDGDYFDHFSIKDATNVDPMSAAAMGLDHFKSRTNYGFEYMKEKPHTRRKESLFHSGGEIHLSTSLSSATRSNSLKAPSVNDRRGSDSPLQDGSESPVFVPLRRKSSKRRNVPSVIAPLGVVTPDQHGADSSSSSGIPGRLLLTPSTPSDSCPSSLLALSPMNDLDRLSPVCLLADATTTGQCFSNSFLFKNITSEI